MFNGLDSAIDYPQIQELLHQKDQRIVALEGELFVLKEQLDWLKRQIFGSKSERIVADLDSNQPLLPELESGPVFVPAQEQEEIVYKRNKPVKNRGCDTISFPDDLPVERIELDLPADEKVCPETGEPLVCIGSEVSRKLARKPEQFYIREYIRFKYASKAVPELGVKSRMLPDAVIARCPADESLLAFVLTSKFADHLPLYRLVEIFNRSDIKISRQTLSKWVLTLGSALTPIYDAMKARVLESGVVFVDETPIDLQVRGKSRLQQAYMWLYVGGGGGDPPYRFFEFCLNRNHDHPLKTLKEYKGVLHSDKYGAYEKLAAGEDIIWCPCMAHVRRKFVEAEGGDPAFRSRILRKIRYLFMLERVAWKRKPDERMRIRREIEKPILDELTKMVKERLLAGKLLPKSNFAKALNYYHSLAPHLSNYHKNADARLDNNVAERGIRPLVIGRKNWLFVGSEDGGRASATILSLVQTCRNLGINPQEYLEDVLRRIMEHPARQIHQLLPDNWLAARQNLT
ncbi:MAG: IS66 family transposase [Syntrophobacteraceae bacterium]|jgi:transposase